MNVGVELAFENHRFWDLKLAMAHKSGMDRLIIPVPYIMRCSRIR